MAPGDDLHVTVAELTALNSSATNDDWTRKPDQTFFLAYDFNPVNSWHFHDPEHYPIFGGEILFISFTFFYGNQILFICRLSIQLFLVEKNHKLFTPQLNHISLRMPPVPPLSQHDEIPPQLLCNESTVANCTKEFCDCTYTLKIALGSLVELVLVDEGI